MKALHACLLCLLLLGLTLQGAAGQGHRHSMEIHSECPPLLPVNFTLGYRLYLWVRRCYPSSGILVVCPACSTGLVVWRFPFWLLREGTALDMCTVFQNARDDCNIILGPYFLGVNSGSE